MNDRAIAVHELVLEADKSAVAVQQKLIVKLANDYAQSAGPMKQLLSSPPNTTQDELSALAAIKETETKTTPLTEKVIALRLVDH